MDVVSNYTIYVLPIMAPKEPKALIIFSPLQRFPKAKKISASGGNVNVQTFWAYCKVSKITRQGNDVLDYS